LRLRRWIGHHSPAFTLEVYGHLLDGGDLSPPLDLRVQVHTARSDLRAVEHDHAHDDDADERAGEIGAVGVEAVKSGARSSERTRNTPP
jgi:hypothetical protein